MLNLVDQAHEGSQPSWGGTGPAVPPSSPAWLPQLSLCLLGFALPSVPAHPCSFCPTIASSYFGPLHLYAPRSRALHRCLGRHQLVQPGQPAPQSSSAHACCAGPPPCWDPPVCINKHITLQTQSCAPKGSDHWMLLLNLS